MRITPQADLPVIPDEKRIRRMICLALGLLTALVYARVVRFDFINYDDPLYVTENDMVRAGLTWKGFLWAFTQVKAAANWHPLTWLSHMLDCQLFGMHPSGPHAVNVLFHIANSILLFLLMLKLTGKMWRSAIVAALFALHPAHVESVAWIAERKDVLSTFFGFSALIAYVNWTRQRRNATRLFALMLFALSLMAKGMLVTLPFLLLLLDYWPLNRLENRGWRTFLSADFRRLLLEKWPWFLMAIVFSVVTFYAQKITGAVAPTQAYSLSFRIGNTFTAYWAYIRELFWPVNLSIFYPLAPFRLIIRVGIAALALVATSVGAFWYSRSRPNLFTGWFWFVGTLVPVIGLVQVGSQSMADRYTYFPSIGIFIAVIWLADDVLERVHASRQAIVAGAAALILLCSALTFVQVGYWRDSITVFSHSFRVVGDNAVTLNNLGTAYADAGIEDKCLYFYNRALAGDPNSAMLQGNFGRALLLTRHPAEALPHLEVALQLAPTNSAYHLYYGNALVKTGKPEQGLEHLRTAALLNTNFARAYSDIGITLVELGHLDEGVSNLQHALQIDTNFVDAYNNLGALFMKQKKIDEALAMYQKALHIEPTNAAAHYNLGLADDKLGRPDAALTNFQAAANSDKKHADARYELGRHLFMMGDLIGAARSLEESLKLKPDRAQAHLYLGLADFELRKEAEALTHLRRANETLTNSLEAVSGLAWVLATADNPDVRNPKEAIKLAELAAAQTLWKQPIILNTVAAAYAADGRFAEALSTARSAAEIAQQQNLPALTANLNSAIQHFEKGEPLYHSKL